MHGTTPHDDLDLAQMLASTRTRHAQTIELIERGAVHGTDEEVVLEQEFPRRVIQLTARVWTNIQVAPNFVATSQQDQVFSAIGKHGIDRGRAAIGDVFQFAERLNRGYCIHRHLSLRAKGPIVARVSH
jgi:hypothetical protein